MSETTTSGRVPHWLRKVFQPVHPERPRWSVTKTLNITCGMVIAWMLVWMFIGSHWRLGIEQQQRSCLPWRFFAVTTQAPETIHRGDIYQFTAKGLPLVPSGIHVIKYVAGVPGDHVVVNANGISINGKYWGPLNPVTMKKGHVTIKEVTKDYVIPKGQLLVLGTTKYSWDSRYWGTINRMQVTARAYPIW